MRALSIQVQPQRTTGLDLDRLVAAVDDIASMTDPVSHHAFDRGHDRGPYLNFTFGTTDAAALWRTIRGRVYDDAELGRHMRAASMAMCSSEAGWDDYLQLYHFDPVVAIDTSL